MAKRTKQSIYLQQLDEVNLKFLKSLIHQSDSYKLIEDVDINTIYQKIKPSLSGKSSIKDVPVLKAVANTIIYLKYSII